MTRNNSHYRYDSRGPMSDTRRSFLQTKILIRLDEKPAKTIAELATRVNSQRPSVSRSLKTLKGQGFVVRTHIGWCLTDAGRKEAEDAKTVMAENVQAMIAGANSFSKSLWSSLQAIDTASLIKPYLASVTASFGSVALEGIKATLGSFDVAAQMQTAIAPILEAQERNRALMSDIIGSATLSYLDEFASKNNLLLAHITDNMFEMRKLSAGFDIPDMSQLLAQTTRVNLALDDIWQQSYKDVLAPLPYPPDVLSASITVPTLAVAHYSDAVTSYMREEAGEERRQEIYKYADEYGDPNLDPLLAKLKPDFVEMRRGSWSALAIGSYDRLRHAATSQRELVRQVFQTVVPDAQLSELENGKPHIKARVKVALGGSKTNAEFAIAMSGAVLALYDQLNKYTHHNEQHEGMLRAILRSGEGLLMFILSAREQ